MASVDRSLIADMPLFSGFGSGELDSVLRGARSIRYPKGSAVFEQDGEAHSFFLLLHGRLRMVRLTPDGQQVVVRFVNPGDIFGIAKAIGRDTCPGTVIAAVDSVAPLWPSSLWPGLVAAHPALAVNTVQTMGARIQEAHTRVVEMSTGEVERRVATRFYAWPTKPAKGHRSETSPTERALPFPETSPLAGIPPQ